MLGAARALTLILIFSGLIVLSDSEVIKLGGQTFVLFIFLLPFCPIESSSSAPLRFHTYLQDRSGLLFFQDYILAFVSPCAKSRCARLHLFQPEDCSSVQTLKSSVYTSLWVPLQDDLMEKATWGERRPSSETTQHCCECHPLLRAGFIACWSRHVDSNWLPNMQLS